MGVGAATPFGLWLGRGHSAQSWRALWAVGGRGSAPKPDLRLRDGVAHAWAYAWGQEAVQSQGLFLIPAARMMILWEVQPVRRGAGSSRLGKGEAGAQIILLAPPMTPELCSPLLSQCLPGGRISLVD